MAKRAIKVPGEPGFTLMTKSGQVLGGGKDLLECLTLLRECPTAPAQLIRNEDRVVLAFTTGHYEKRGRRMRAN